MANYVIVGAGASGLYTAYRLLSGGTLQAGDTVQLYEWSQRPGGRIFTYTFPDQPDGLYAELGGMRFAVDQGFPNTIVQGHVLVQNTIVAMDLADKVVDFGESPQRMYYLRGHNVYENSLSSLQALQALPYNFNAEFIDFVQSIPTAPPPVNYTADTLLGAIASVFAPGLGSNNADRAAWCNYYAIGEVGSKGATTAFPAETTIGNIGYWNLLYDQFGDEGFDYSADGTGYTSNVINWNAADAMQANNDYGSSTSYKRLDGGYSLLFEALANEVDTLAQNYPGSGIFYGWQLTSLEEAPDNQTVCAFAIGDESEDIFADQLFLAMPRRSLELVAGGCAPGYMLNLPQVKYYLESSIDQPAIKVLMVFDEAWWTTSACAFPPYLTPVGDSPSQGVGGPSITDLPLRMVYYFANNVPGGPGTSGGPYVLLASYDDMNYSSFWREMELSGLYETAPSLVRQPLSGPTEVPADSPLAGILIKQLAEMHGTTPHQVPAPLALYFQDWGQDPFGGGYHGWSSHYNICQAMDFIRAPYARILGEPSRKTYIIGSCYSFDQAWVEGAFCVAESVLQDFLGLSAFNGVSGYTLICRNEMGEAAPASTAARATARSPKARHNRAHRG
ncbi:MAG: flavin monoamine oxidase family protein [Allosphingosinicella sp.]